MMLWKLLIEYSRTLLSRASLGHRCFFVFGFSKIFIHQAFKTFSKSSLLKLPIRSLFWIFRLNYFVLMVARRNVPSKQIHREHLRLCVCPHLRFHYYEVSSSTNGHSWIDSVMQAQMVRMFGHHNHSVYRLAIVLDNTLMKNND